MVKKTFLAAFFIFALSLMLHGAGPLESPSVELLSGEENIKNCISILETAKQEEGLEPVDYLSLYYFLKADGEREKAILTVLEGLDAEPSSPVAPMLADIVEEEMTYNALTERISENVLSSALKADGEDPLLRFGILRSLFVIASRKGDLKEINSILDRMGIPGGAFFETPDEDIPRTGFLGATPSFPAGRELTFFPRSNQFQKMPSSLLSVKGEYLGRMHVPFNSSAKGEFYLLVSARTPVKVSIDGVRVFENNPFFEKGPPVNILRLSLEPGGHIMSAAFHSVNASDGLSFAIFPKSGSAAGISFLKDMPSSPFPDGCALNGKYEHPVSLGIQPSDHLSLGLNGLLCRAAADYPRARHFLRQAIEANPHYLLWKLALAELIIEKSYDLPESYALSRAEALIDEVLSNNPDCPEAMFYKIYLKSTSSQGEEFLGELGKLTEGSPSDPRWFIQLSRELVNLGWNVAAKDVLLRTRTLFPQNSQVEEEWLSFCDSRKNRRDQLEALGSLSKLRIAPEEYENYYAATGDYGRALEWLEKQKEAFGDNYLYLEEKKVDYLEKTGKLEDALSAADSLLVRNPRNLGWNITKARLLYLSGKNDEAEKLLDSLKSSDPSAFNIDYTKWLQTGELPFENERIPFEEALAGPDHNPGGAPSSYLLDHQITRVFEDGSILERYHGVVAVHDRDGVEREGEQQFPSGYLLVLRTIKADGRVVEPEIVANKKTIGMSGLEVGDIVEYEYLAPAGPNGIKKGSYYTPYVFMFQDMEKPFARTSWTIKYPSSFKMAFFEQNLPSPPSETTNDGLTVRKYEYRSMPRLAFEPDLPFRNLYLPLADAVGNLDWKDFALALQNEVTGSFPVSPEISEKCGELLKGTVSEKEKADAIIDFLMAEIDGEGKGWGDPTETLLLGEGNRLQLAMAMLTAARVRFDFLFAESVTQSRDKNDLPTEGRYQIPILRIYRDGAPADYFLDSPYRDIKVLPWYLQGARALSVTSPEPWKALILQEDWKPWESCSQFEQRDFDRSGGLEVGLSQALDPDQSAQLRGALKKIPKDRWKDVLQVAFAKQFGNVEITTYDFRNLDDSSKSLIMTAAARVAAYAAVTGGVLRIEEPIARLELMKNFGSLEKRELPLSTSSPFIINQTYKITLPAGKVSAVLPKKERISSRYGSYSISVKKSAGGFTIFRKASIPFGIIPPEEYPAFVSFLKRIDETENMAVEVRLE